MMVVVVVVDIAVVDYRKIMTLAFSREGSEAGHEAGSNLVQHAHRGRSGGIGFDVDQAAIERARNIDRGVDFGEAFVAAVRAGGGERDIAVGEAGVAGIGGEGIDGARDGDIGRCEDDIAGVAG